MQGVYNLTGTIAAVTTAKTLAWIATAATKPIEIYSIRVTCENEDTSEQIYLSFNRITTIGAAAGTTEVAKPTEEGSAAYTGTCTLNLTTEPTTYDDITDAIFAGGANKLAGWEYVPLPEERPIINAADDVGLVMIDAIANSSDLSVSIMFREL